MRIDELDQDEARLRREKVIRDVQRYAEEQDQATGGKQRGAVDDDVQQSRARERNHRSEIDEAGEGTQLRREVEQHERRRAHEGPDASRVTGEQKHSEAVATASKQQDAGENWQGFAAVREARELPPSVEDMAQQRGERGDEDPDKIQARDLQNELAVRNKQIRG